MYGQWQANYSVKINVGTVGGKPVVAGIALSANPATGSDFIVMSDRFAVVPPGYSNSTQTKMPFVVGQVNGINTVGIQGQLLVDDSITANKIKTNTLSAVTANAGTINGGTFKTHTLDANGNVTDPTEFRAEMSNVGNWPLWIGSGTKTANNAVVWIDKQGNAEFKGKIKAGNVVGQFQRATAVDWSGEIPLDYIAGVFQKRFTDYQTITTFSLAAPMLAGETHVPSIVLHVLLNFQEGKTIEDHTNTIPELYAFGVNILLEENVNSTWKVIFTHKPAEMSCWVPAVAESNNLYKMIVHTGSDTPSLIANGSPTASARQFRVRARFRKTNQMFPKGGMLHKVVGVQGRVIGIR